MHKENIEQIDREISDVAKQREKLGNSLQDHKKLLADKRTQHKAALIANADVKKVVTEIATAQIEIQGLLEAIKELDGKLETLQHKRDVEFQWFAVERAGQIGGDALAAFKPMYQALVEFVEASQPAREKSNELRSFLKKVKRPTPMTNLNQRILRLFEHLEKALPEILETYPKEIFADGKLPEPAELLKRLKGAVAPTANTFKKTIAAPQKDLGRE